MPSTAPQTYTLKTFTAKGPGADISGQKVDYGFHPTPLGRCLIGALEGRICHLAFAPTGSDSQMLQDLSARWSGATLDSNCESTGRIMERVFSKTPSAEPATELMVRGTPFQVEVWKALLGIPHGTVRSYAEVAQSIGRPRAVRAVGTAIGANPIAWLIPCHRVIRSDGGLGGYRWGIAAKKACLDYEKSR